MSVFKIYLSMHSASFNPLFQIITRMKVCIFINFKVVRRFYAFLWSEWTEKETQATCQR